MSVWRSSRWLFINRRTCGPERKTKKTILFNIEISRRISFQSVYKTPYVNKILENGLKDTRVQEKRLVSIIQ